MSFAKFFSKSNSSIQSLQGNILECTIEQLHQNRVTINTGLRTSFLCIQEELDFPISNRKNTQLLEPNPQVEASFPLMRRASFFPGYLKKNYEFSQEKLMPTTFLSKTSLENKKLHSEFEKCFDFNQFCCFIGIEERRSRSEARDFVCSSPKSMERMSRRKFVWAELTKLWHSKKKHRVSGFILNPVNGGFAVAIAGYIAFLPKSLCFNRKSFIGQWRQFSILSMNPKIANIVVKEIKTVNTSKVQKKEPKFQKSHGFRSKSRRFRR